MKTYIGLASRSVLVKEDDQDWRPLAPRWDLRNHSPDGFNWGYTGSGPAQLALAMMCDLLGDDAKALKVYQDFKDKWVTRIAKQGVPWDATEAQLWTFFKDNRIKIP